MKINKIIIIAPGKNSNGGIYTFLLRMHEQFLRHFTISYIDCSREGLFVLKFTNFLKSIIYLFVKIIFDRPDYVYLHTAGGRIVFRDFLYYFISKIFRIKFALHIHSFSNLLDNNFYNYLFLRLVKRSNITFTFNKELCMQLKDIGVNCILINNPAIDLKYLNRLSSEIDKKRNNTIIFAGHISHRKGVDIFQQIIYQLNNSGFKVNFNVYGSGDLNLISHIQSTKNVIFKYGGILNNDELLREIIASKILLLPSREEGMPMCILEALSCKTFVVSSNVGSIPYISNDKNIFRISDFSINEYVENIIYFLRKQNINHNRSFKLWYKNFSPNFISSQINLGLNNA